MQNATKFLTVIGILLTLTVFITQVSAESETNKQEDCANVSNTRITNAQEAYQKGELTQRQMEILQAREEFKGMGQNRGGEKGRMIELLNEQGLNVTHEEMQEIKEAMQELGIRGNGRRHK